ncbi:serine/threonine-protein kinase [Streptomyces eurocidicus]|uniref:non-specific serine/threonine protein kinase n=1 Tax=Streptomyces eurocidicus TaxID=66423 RepID=A0A7W8BAU9_STREU|nr:serine/threonine-protein kinase [Streptomyces eurocidicus]MBB5119976.1 serine/threonine-protein kinase PknG [Streptomyces eurocidicus]MBF6051802.1 protein kinase [Streptomyces eurocidicus]
MTPQSPQAPHVPRADCDRPDCQGCSADGTGFCRVTGHALRTPTEADGLAESPPTAGTHRRRVTDRLFTVDPAGDGLLDLPVVHAPSPGDLVVTDRYAPPGGRTCGWAGCTAVVGRAYAGQPALTTGFCGRCGHPYDFTPQLSPGDLVGEQYRVVGCLANGGLGWVYLAEDIHLEQRLVALKGLIHAGDSLGALRVERDHLTRLDHPRIVRIINYVTHPGLAGTDEPPVDYIVMEFVNGMSLSQVRDRIGRREGPFGEERVFEYVLAYGCHILDALDHLHREGLLYCDLKPNNVMHHGDRVKLIDLGATRTVDDHESPVMGARPFMAPEVIRDLATGLSPQSDLYSAGMTLRALSDEAGPRPPGLAGESYERAVARAVAEEPLARYPGARAMSEQLRGVLREIRSLRTEHEHPEPSTLFTPTAALLDASLGRVPPLARWLSGGRRPVLDGGLPAPGRVPLDLPVPSPDPADPAAMLLLQPTTSGPRRLVQQLEAAGYGSVEIRLRQCRASLELGELDEAARYLTAARHALDHGGLYDWRIQWHQGLLSLAQGETDTAEGSFDRVYSDLPGEYAPKLALGYCAEHRGDPDSAERYYQAVWQRNRSQGSAAFGLARLRLADGDRTGAVALLSRVPEVSRHHDAARTACVRILAGRLRADAGRGLPVLAELTEALTRLPELYLDEGHRTGPARDRLEAEILDVALDWIRAESTPAADRTGGGLFGTADEEFAIRTRLEAKLRGLARQASTPADLGALVDLANRVRPKTRF